MSFQMTSPCSACVFVPPAPSTTPTTTHCCCRHIFLSLSTPSTHTHTHLLLHPPRPPPPPLPSEGRCCLTHAHYEPDHRPKLPWQREHKGRAGWGGVGGGRVYVWGGGSGGMWTGRKEGTLTEREERTSKALFFPLPFLFFLQAVMEKDSEQEGGTGSEGHVSLITQHGRGKHCH